MSWDRRKCGWVVAERQRGRRVLLCAWRPARNALRQPPAVRVLLRSFCRCDLRPSLLLRGPLLTKF